MTSRLNCWTAPMVTCLSSESNSICISDVARCLQADIQAVCATLPCTHTHTNIILYRQVKADIVVYSVCVSYIWFFTVMITIYKHLLWIHSFPLDVVMQWHSYTSAALHSLTNDKHTTPFIRSLVHHKHHLVSLVIIKYDMWLQSSAGDDTAWGWQESLHP